MQKLKSIRIICDNGGGITLQAAIRGLRYQHCYDDASQCARDIRAAVTDPSGLSGWEGNEADQGWLEPSDDDIRNGGYRVFDDPYDVAGDSGWHNVDLLAEALTKAI